MRSTRTLRETVTSWGVLSFEAFTMTETRIILYSPSEDCFHCCTIDGEIDVTRYRFDNSKGTDYTVVGYANVVNGDTTELWRVIEALKLSLSPRANEKE